MYIKKHIGHQVIDLSYTNFKVEIFLILFRLRWV